MPKNSALTITQSFGIWSKLERWKNLASGCLIKANIAQLCPTLCDPMDYTIHGILQGRILEWVAIPFPGGSSQPRDWTQVSHIAGRFFTSWATREAQGAWWADWKSKHCHFEVSSSLILCNKWTNSWSDCDVRWKVDFIQWLAMTNSVAELRRCCKALPKAKLPPKSGHGWRLVFWYWSDTQQLSESQRNHHIWEVGSVNQWDTLKTAMPAAGIGSQKEPNSSLQQCLTAHRTTNASKVEQIGLRSFASVIFSWPLASQLTRFFQHLDNFFLQRKNLHNQQEADNPFQEFVKSQSIDFYAIGINELISHWQKCMDCNGSYFD